jgi:hypothetical protein
VDSSFKGSNSSGSRESEASEDRQFRREMEEYDEIMARAHQIAESSRRRQELEWDSDGDLSVLASSLFNGMEGIEQGGSTTIRQDDQGDGGVQGEIEGSGIMQGLIFSPRKTRSGRVLR